MGLVTVAARPPRPPGVDATSSTTGSRRDLLDHPGVDATSSTTASRRGLLDHRRPVVHAVTHLDQHGAGGLGQDGAVLSVRRAPRRRVAFPALLGSVESVTALTVAHVVAGGEMPQPLWLAAFGALVYAASLPVLRQRAGIGLVLPALVVVQVLGHAWLVALTPASHAGHGHDGGVLLGLSPAMLAAHAVAALVTGVMWAVRRRVVDVLVQWADPALVPAPAATRGRVLPRVVRPSDRRLVGAAPTRGPPALLATA
jgi:hypothetical protein